MSDDFDVFGDTPAPAAAPESDPAADFLATQQQKLGGLLDDDFSGFGGDSQAGPAQDSPYLPEVVQQPTAGGDMFSGDANDFDQAPAEQPSPFASFAPEPAAPAPSSAPGRPDWSALRSEMGESDKVRQWRDAQRERLAKKDVEEDTRRKDGFATAKRELDDWYKHYNEQVGKTRAANLDMEKMLIAERNETLPTGTEVHKVLWERVSRMCEFNPKNSKCQKDVTRFRSLLLSLKQTPPIRT